MVLPAERATAARISESGDFKSCCKTNSFAHSITPFDLQPVAKLN